MERYAPSAKDLASRDVVSRGAPVPAPPFRLPDDCCLDVLCSDGFELILNWFGHLNRQQ